MAGGTGVAQITSPGRSIPGMAPISAIARPGDFAYDPQAQKTGVLPGPPSNMQPQFDPSKSQINDFFRGRSGNMQGQPSVGAFEPNLPPGMQGQGFSYGPDGQMQQGMQRIPQQNPNLFDNSSRPSFMNNLGAGKGGGGQPAMPSNLAGQPPQQGQYAPMAPQGQFNVNQASAGALQQALGTTQQAMQRPIDIGAYANPYENQVVQQSMRDVGSAAKMGLNQLDAQAGAAKAFGGSRHGIAQAETMKGFNQQAMDQAAQLRSQGFNTSLQAAMADRQARLGAASQLGNLGQQAFGVGQTIQGNQQQQGLLQQSIQQALIDAARQQYAGYTGAPQTALQAPLAALGVTPTPQTTTNSMQPGLFNYLQLGAGMVGGSK